MRDLIVDLKRLESGDFPGISQVYLIVVWADYNRQSCTKQYIHQHANIEWDLLQDYLEFLVRENYIHRNSDNKYTIFLFQDATSAESVVTQLHLTGVNKTNAQDLLNEMSSRQKDAARFYGDIAAFLTKFRNFFGAKKQSDILDLLRIINTEYKTVSMRTLSPTHIMSALKNQHLCERQVVEQKLAETGAAAKRVARFIRQVIKQNPEYMLKNGKLIRARLDEFLKTHYRRFPDDRVPLELLEPELSNLNIHLF